MTEENKETKLTDEEVWLRAYCALISNPNPMIIENVWVKEADRCLKDFKDKFRNNND